MPNLPLIVTEFRTFKKYNSNKTNLTSSPYLFFAEISKGNTYRLLFPDPKAGLAVIWLYEKIESGFFPTKAFKEKDIHEALRAVNAPIEREQSRHPLEHYNTIIANLQEYFLRYDEERREYLFKEYAYEFCRKAKEVLQSSYSPTRIENMCASLREKLQLADSHEKLAQWFDEEFQIFKPHLKSQLDFLDRQIDQSVSELRSNRKLSLQEGTILETLQQIDQRFEVIRTQNKELRSAFREMDRIRRLLDEATAQHDDETLQSQAYHATFFFQDMRRTLSIIDKRLDRIQPKIKQLFSNLNKPLFNARVERFLSHLLEASTVAVFNGKKELQLPSHITTQVMLLVAQDFTIVERKSNLFPTKAQKRIVTQQSSEGRKEAINIFKEQLFQQDKVSSWLEVIQKELLLKGHVRLETYFFQILSNGQGANLALAIMVLYRALRYFEKQPDIEIQVDSGQTARKSKTKTTLWRITIQQQKQRQLNF